MDTSFYDRLHSYIPGWEFGKTRDDIYTSHFGFVSDYLAEVLHNLRKTTYNGHARAVVRVRQPRRRA